MRRLVFAFSFVAVLVTGLAGCTQVGRVGEPHRDGGSADGSRVPDGNVGPARDGGTTDAQQPTTCIGRCDAFAGDGCIDDELLGMCRTLCTTENESLVVSCLSRREGCALPTECQFDESIDTTIGQARTACGGNCRELGMLRCIPSVDVAPCSDLCQTADADQLRRFDACVNANFCRDDTCYRILNPEGASPDAAGCEAACDEMHNFDCIDSFALSACRALCRTTTDAAAVQAFKACNNGICRNDSCYSIFRRDAS